MSPTEVKNEFRVGALRIATALEARTGSDRLTVVLNGYCDRSKQWPPVFAQWPSSETFGHILRICDPSLFMSDWVNGSCFWGTETDDPVPAIVESTRKIANELGVQPNRVVYFGHSGAGFGALQCAINDNQASAIGINPILEPKEYNKYDFAQAMAKIFRPNASGEELQKEYPEKFSITEAVRTAHKQQRKPRLGLIQNILDRHHFGKHFIPFCWSVGIAPIGGVDRTGFIRAKTYFLSGGHSALPQNGNLVENLFRELLSLGSDRG